MKRMLPVFLMLFVAVSLSANELIVKADSLYELRSQGFNEETMIADSMQIDQSIQAYKDAIESSQDEAKQEAVWKLMRAFYFKGHYCTDNVDLQKKIFDLGKEWGQTGLNEFPESIGVHLWTAILWGVWGEAYGTFAAAREGVAGKIREHSEKVIEIDPDYKQGAGYRVLGRLHFKAPKIPFILGWPSKKKAVEYLEKAYKISPDHIMTTQYLAEALWERGQKDRAVELMNRVITMDRSVGLVEDAVAKKSAKKILEEWQ